ncbi:hypothetical protein HanRHA438_Chr04g0178121 [Helianthus annuus]|nr:hypothetical protein HanIR_Chr04g0181941 [Helianthus annuus]KAJ0927032.1 hypothetical protein HanRHA438_Chr04g0178121 [Helianthus annuus]
MRICTNTLALDRKLRVQAFTLPVCTCSHYLDPNFDGICKTQKALSQNESNQKGSKPYNRRFKT